MSSCPVIPIRHPVILVAAVASFAFGEAVGSNRPEPPPLPQARQSESVLEPADAALHVRIDRLIAAARPDFAQIAAPVCSDAEFMRRVSLDLAGSVPSSTDIREFLAADDPPARKRTQLIDRLLTSPRHARRLQYVFDEMIMERRTGTSVSAVDWQNWLRTALRENRRWDSIVAEILAADGADAEKRPAARFYLDRNFDVDVVTRDVGRIFLGVDLECAQCHDHPTIDGYLQRHYWGISAFLKRSYVFTDTKTKQKMLGEKAEGDVKFTSVFTAVEGMTEPRLIELPEIPDPEGVQQAYLTKPESKVRGIPRYSRRLQLPKAMISVENIDFRRNIVNRIWALMMGRGLVEPLDVRHQDNPPSHPDLLDLLAEDFHRHNYDLRRLLRELALTQTYQRRRMAIDTVPDARAWFAVAGLKTLSPEQLAWSAMDVMSVSEQTLQKKKDELLKQDADNGPARVLDPLWQEEAVHDALKANVDQFVTQFAGQGGQKTGFESNAVQALFLINGPLVQSWLAPAAGNLTDRLRMLDDAERLAEELYMSVLSRPPGDAEIADVAAYLESAGDRAGAVQELAWALLTSAEFRFNH